LNRNNHIIRRQAIEVKLASERNAAAVHDQVRNIYLDKIIPKLDSLFSDLTTDEVVLRINHLQLDLGVVEMDKLEEQFSSKIMLALRESLEKKLQFDIDSDIELVQKQQSFVDIFLYFLEWGQLPWWSHVKDLRILEKEISQQSSNHEVLRKRLSLLIADQPLSGERLAFQFSNIFLELISRLYFPLVKASELLDELVSFFSSIQSTDPRHIRDLFWETVCTNLDQSPGNILTTIIDKIINSSTKKYNLSRSEILLPLSQCDAVAFPVLHSFFITNPGYNKEKEVENKSKTEHKQDKVNRSPADDSESEKYEENTAHSEVELPGVVARNEKPAESTMNDEINSGKAGIDPDKIEMKDTEGQVIENSDKARAGLNQKDVLINKSRQKDRLKKQAEGAIIYPGFAGLVILHPFLSPFFKGLELTDGKRFLHEEAFHKAIALLAYMATGETEVQEQRLVIPKLICGMDTSMPVRKNILITAGELNETDKLLAAVIGHWTALKNTSIGGLRDTFLKREGKLSHNDSGWQLEVEHKTVDILLGKLPWGFSMIRFSWMKELLFVNWGNG
jgi:hypothetical protein